MREYESLHKRSRTDGRGGDSAEYQGQSKSLQTVVSAVAGAVEETIFLKGALNGRMSSVSVCPQMPKPRAGGFPKGGGQV